MSSLLGADLFVGAHAAPLRMLGPILHYPLMGPKASARRVAMCRVRRQWWCPGQEAPHSRGTGRGRRWRRPGHLRYQHVQRRVGTSPKSLSLCACRATRVRSAIESAMSLPGNLLELRPELCMLRAMQVGRRRSHLHSWQQSTGGRGRRLWR